MTPKEKAQELFNTIYNISGLTKESKQLALVAVDEIILEREVIFAARDIPTSTFWHEVKAEIKAL